MPLARHLTCWTAVLTLVAGPALAARDERTWRLDGPLLAQGLREAPVLAWNPRDPAANNRPGLKLAFFGQATGCSDPSGDLAPLGAGFAARARALSGLASDALQAWSPLAAAGCRGAGGARDDSFIAIDTATAGVGLYTGTGPDSQGQTGFFGPFAATGQDGAGANAGIEGSFLTWRLDWRDSDTLRPWAAGDGAALRWQSVQRLAVLRVPADPLPRPTQAKQQLTLGLINTDCMAERGAAARPCQLKLLFTVAIGRSGVGDWSAVPWFQRARVLFDRGQGGIPVLDTGLPAAGQGMRSGPGGPVLFESEGAPTRHGPFDETRFAVRMDWPQFTDTLRVIAAARRTTPAARIDDREVAALFGSRWAAPAAWALLSVSVGQEVSTPQAQRPAAIGGAVQSIEVEAARRR